MIPVSAYMDHGLSELMAQLQHAGGPLTQGTPFGVDVVSLGDPGATQDALSTFHAHRWPDVEGALQAVDDRVADLGEVVAALYVLSTPSGHDAEDVFPRCLVAASRRTSESGLDVVAVNIDDLHDAPLQADEILVVIEVKHTKNSPESALRGLRDDLEKTNDERVTDFLTLLMSYLETRGFSYPERVHRFLTDKAVMCLSALIDSNHIDLDGFKTKADETFDSSESSSGMPVIRFVVTDIPDTNNWVAEAM